MTVGRICNREVTVVKASDTLGEAAHAMIAGKMVENCMIASQVCAASRSALPIKVVRYPGQDRALCAWHFCGPCKAIARRSKAGR